MIRDLQNSFTDASSQTYMSIVGPAGTYLAPNSIDTSPFGTTLTELTPNDTVLSAFSNTMRDMGGGDSIWCWIDWIQAPVGGTSVDMQLITSASSSMSSPVVMATFGVQAIASLPLGTRQQVKLPRSANWLQWIGLQAITAGVAMTAGQFIAALVLNPDSAIPGYATGFQIK